MLFFTRATIFSLALIPLFSSENPYLAVPSEIIASSTFIQSLFYPIGKHYSFSIFNFNLIIIHQYNRMVDFLVLACHMEIIGFRAFAYERLGTPTVSSTSNAGDSRSSS